MGEPARAADDPAPPRAGFRRVARLAGLFVLCLLAAVDLAAWDAEATGFPWLAAVFALALGLAAVGWPAHRRPPWLTPEIRAGVPAAVSLVFTVGNHLADGPPSGGPGEVLALLCLLLVAVRGARS